MMMPGAVFSVTESPSSYIRTSFAYADDKDIVEGFRYAVQCASTLHRTQGSTPVPNPWPRACVCVHVTCSRLGELVRERAAARAGKAVTNGTH